MGGFKDFDLEIKELIQKLRDAGWMDKQILFIFTMLLSGQPKKEDK